MKIEFLYFDGCPNHEPALQNLKEVMQEMGIHDEIEIIKVFDNDDAMAKRFLGSPSIRINGQDLEQLDETNHNYIMCCRQYRTGSLAQGCPSKELIQQAFQRAMSKEVHRE